jgi:hypothetical protein
MQTPSFTLGRGAPSAQLRHAPVEPPEDGAKRNFRGMRATDRQEARPERGNGECSREERGGRAGDVQGAGRGRCWWEVSKTAHAKKTSESEGRKCKHGHGSGVGGRFDSLLTVLRLGQQAEEAWRKPAARSTVPPRASSGMASHSAPFFAPCAAGARS